MKNISKVAKGKQEIRFQIQDLEVEDVSMVHQKNDPHSLQQECRGSLNLDFWFKGYKETCPTFLFLP